MPHSPSPLYRGHRRQSFVDEDADELVELRARQRTFDGAYIRTALGSLGYAGVILKVFSNDFAKIGLVYVILALLLLLIAFQRRRRSDHDFADEHRIASSGESATPLVGNQRIWGRNFKTSGDVVLLIGFVVTGLYIAMFVLILKI